MEKPSKEWDFVTDPWEYLANRMWPHIHHLEADNARLRDLLMRVLTVCKTDLHIKGVLSQLGADILEALEDKP